VLTADGDSLAEDDEEPSLLPEDSAPELDVSLPELEDPLAELDVSLSASEDPEPELDSEVPERCSVEPLVSSDLAAPLVSLDSFDAASPLVALPLLDVVCEVEDLCLSRAGSCPEASCT
jgi:hypothetical protein